MVLHRRLFAFLLVLLPTQLGVHFWPTWAHVLGRRIDYLSPTIYLTDIIIFLLIGTRMMSGKFGNYGKLVFFVVLYAAVNIYGAASPWVALYKWVKVFEFAGLGWYVVQTKPKLSVVSRQLSVGVLYSSLIAIGQFALQRSIGGPLWLLGERTFGIDTPGIARWAGFGRVLLRPYATFPHPNVLGGYLAVLLPAILQYVNKPINKYSNKTKFFFAITIASGIVALVLTFSRSAWIVAAAGFLFFSRQNKKYFFVFLSVIFVAITLFFRPSTIDESVVRRVELNQAAVAMWERSPLFGVGLGNFLTELPTYSMSRQANFLQPVHNIYLLMLAETGVVGLAMFVWVLWKGMKGNKGYWGIALMSLLIIGLVDHYPATLQQGQLLFTLVVTFVMIQ